MNNINFSYARYIVSPDISGKLNFVPKIYIERNKTIRECEDKARARESMTLERNVDVEIHTVDQDLSLLQCRLYLATRYFDISEKNMIKFNGPSGCGIPAPGEQPINTRGQGGYKSQDKQEPVFFYPLDFRRVSPRSSAAFSELVEKGALPFLHSTYELLGGRT